MTKAEELKVEALRRAFKYKVKFSTDKSVLEIADEYYAWLRGSKKEQDLPPDPRQGGPDPHDMH